MDERNYGSFEAGQCLQAAGIMLETEKVWYTFPCESDGTDWKWKLGEIGREVDKYVKHYPAPSMAEVWRELLGILSVNKRWYELRLIKVDDITQVGYWWLTECLIEFQNRINPADALIDLLIWVEQRKEEHHDRQTQSLHRC